MILPRWFRPNKRSLASFRPTLTLLEDRTVPSGFRHHLPPAGPATHLALVVPQQARSGREFHVLVKALDASNHRATDYAGTVHFTLGTIDAAATVPADYAFTANDRGVHFFHFTLSATGSQTITATDTVTATITGSATTTVNPAPVASQLFVFAPHHMTQGVPTYVTVVARDASGHRVSNYTGTVSFASSDAAATLPANYTFATADRGRHTFQVILPTAGTQTVTATDTATATITGQASLTVDAVGPITHFRVSAWKWASVGVARSFQVAALDANNRVVAAYRGTVQFASTDAGATLPSAYTFVAGDYGRHIFAATFGVAGKQTLTVTDAADSAIVGTVKFRVF